VKLAVQPGAGVGPIVRAITSARKRIDILVFRFDRDVIEQALAAAVNRGVTVRALIAHTNRGGGSRLRKLEQRLLAAGVTVSRTADDLVRYHGKFMIVDSVLHLYGFNFTKLDIEQSRSFAIATRDAKSVSEAARLFEADMNRQSYSAGSSRLVISPANARETLGAFITGARKELAIYDAKIHDPQMIKLLKARAAKGIRIRVLGSMKGKDPGIQECKLDGLRLHVRAIVRDGTQAFVGSQSLRKLELDNRREVGLIISNPAVARKILQVFESDWSASIKAEKTKAKTAA
jgi:phosphatidylserine/phosphatidylglycerophosphate/cardiolipin synthase-like enzyme